MENEVYVALFILMLGILYSICFLDSKRILSWIKRKTTRNKREPNILTKIGKLTVFKRCIHQDDLVSVHTGKFEDDVDCAVKVMRHFGTNPCRSRYTEFLNSLSENEKASKLSYIKPDEIQISQKIMSDGHVNIVRYFCHEFGEWEHPGENSTIYTIYIATELCHYNLEDFIKERTIDIEQLSTDDICLQIAHGLAYLHEKKIVHRDLKPANILLKKASDTFIVKLADFGMSKYISQSSEAILSMACGTPGWQAPEIQTENEKVGGQDQNKIQVNLKKSDVYSLGRVFCFVVTNGLHTDVDFDLVNAKCKDSYTMKELIRGMTSLNPEQRPTAENVLKHPAMWTAKRTLEFFSKSSDVIFEDRNAHLDIENRSDKIFRNDWKDALDIDVQNDLFSQIQARHRQPYEPSSVKDLLRAIRNKYSHPDTALFGSYPDQYLKYWTSRFPCLLLRTYTHMGNVQNAQVMEFY